jgi:predicted ATPase/class 3 adenylate cyclase
MMSNLPSGTVTFLFTDIEGSTRLWEAHPQSMKPALARHDALLRHTIEDNGGYVFKTVGDAFCAAFPTALFALQAALQAQRLLIEQDWGETPIKVRMALHSGAADERDGDYFGPPLNRIARLLSAGYGGQILLTAVTAELVRDHLPAGVSLVDLGPHLLKDLLEAETILQVVGHSLERDFPPLRTTERLCHNLPSRLTALVGRRKEVEGITALLRDPGVRLVTLTGMGGTGKTRLALQVATETAVTYRHGAAFVDLSPLIDPHGVARAVVNALNLPTSGQEEPESVLRSYLAHRQSLLLLDNFEQVIAEAPFITSLLSGSAELQILVTSREPLRVSGEYEYPVPPLTLPVSHNGYGLSPDDLLQYEAIALFVDRARLVRPDFQLDAHNAGTVAAICARLDGLPLAIELAAARIRLFSPQALLERLNERLKTLNTGLRDVPVRQQTLRGAIDWSYLLLNPDEQILFRRLAVFSGGFGFETAEAICGPGLALNIDTGLESLLNKSLLKRLDMAGGAVRFTMLETIGEYARERLVGSGELEEMRNRHAEYFHSLAADLGHEMRTHRQLEWFNRLEPERDNLRATLDYLLGGADVARGAEMAAALSEYWLYTYQYAESKTWLDRAAVVRNRSPLPVQVDVLMALGLLAVYRVTREEGIQVMEEALELLQEFEDPKRQAWAELIWAVNAVDFQTAEALVMAQRSLETFRSIGFSTGITQALNVYGEVLRFAGEIDQAESFYKQVIPVAQEIGDFRRLIMQFANLGQIAFGQGDLAGMLHYAELGIPLSLIYHVEETTTQFLMFVAHAAAGRGEGELAATLLGAAVTWHVEMSVNQQFFDAPVVRSLKQAILDQIDEGTLERGFRRGAEIGLQAAATAALEAMARLKVAPA